MESNDVDKKKFDKKDRFESVAKELECDESDDALDKAMKDLSLETEKDEDHEAD